MHSPICTAGEKGDTGSDGSDGAPGLPGPPGPSGDSSGGVTYVRWGRTNCSNVTGTEVVYCGRAAGTSSNK